MLLGLGLLYVGAVLILNGIWLLGHIQDKEIWVINFFTGGLVLIIALFTAFNPDADRIAVFAAAQFLLFSFTYIWVGIGRFINADGRGLGWFCLFVAITAVPIAITTLTGSDAIIWLGLNWSAWAVLWFIYWLLLALGKTQLTRFSGAFTIVVGVLTGWIPGYLLLAGVLSV